MSYEREDKGGRLDAFAGSDPAAYKMWRRRAKMMLAGLPTTVGAAKYGARLMELVKGEAEVLVETLDVEEIIPEDGDKKIFAPLDETYMPQPRDLLQAALRGYFYELYIKPAETYQQFFARYEAAARKLRQQQEKLPDKVLGFMLLKKMKMESNQESLALTATQGALEQSVRSMP